MNITVAANLFENPLVLLVIIGLFAFFNWLMRKRQANQADSRPDGDSAPPLPRAQRPSERELDMEEVMRRLLGGEPPLRAPSPPPIDRVLYEEQDLPAWSDEEEFPSERRWADKEATDPVPPRPVKQTPEALRRPAAPAQVTPVVHRVSEGRGLIPRRFKQADQLSSRPGMDASPKRRRRSREGPRAVALVRDARTLRQVFIASLVFGPPKAFETGRQ